MRGIVLRDEQGKVELLTDPGQSLRNQVDDLIAQVAELRRMLVVLSERQSMPVTTTTTWPPSATTYTYTYTYDCTWATS